MSIILFLQNKLTKNFCEISKIVMNIWMHVWMGYMSNIKGSGTYNTKQQEEDEFTSHCWQKSSEICDWTGCLYDNWKSSFFPVLIFHWRTFLRRVTARWWRQSAKYQVWTNQNSRNRWCLIVGRTICVVAILEILKAFILLWLQ